EDFDSGEPDGVSVWAPGQITLGPKAVVTEIDALYVWALAEDGKGNIYAGTGNDGKIFRIAPEGKSEVFADLELQQALALVFDKQENVVYASGFPGGKVYSINGKGEVSDYFDTGQNSVWALSLGAKGALFAATGDEGRIYRIEAGGKGSLLYDSPERRVLSLAVDHEGNLYAGTEQSGLIYKFDTSGRPFVLYDTELEEVTSMTLDDEGNLYAVSSPGGLFAKIPPIALPSVPRPPQDASQGGGALLMESAAQAPPMMPGMPVIPTPKKRTCIVYKIAKDGTASKFWTSPEKLVFSIAFSGGNLLAGTGDDGVIYSVSPTGEAATYYKSDQKQALDLHRAADGSIAASLGNNAGIVRFSGGYSEKGVYISPVHDATAQSRWGKIFWEAETPSQAHASFATRSGNSETPDDTWSDWSKEHAEGFVSESPMARYMQWRVKLSSANPRQTPTVRIVTAAYLQANVAPEVKSVKAETAGEGQKEGAAAGGGGDLAKALKSLSSGGAPGSEGKEGGAEKATKDGVKTAPSSHETKLKIRWEAKDENGDTLQYEVYFKGLEETRWKLIKDELSVTSYEWDTQAVPDGEYHVKVMASDSPGNPEQSALKAERVSESFTIDNTAPVAGPLKTAPSSAESEYQISSVVSDNVSPVRSAQYSIDAGDWMTTFPVDGIFDSLSEKVEFSTGKLERGEHTVVLKVTDYYGNVGAAKSTFVVK
ncbi:hypothetical protein HZA56_00695, partial [Candidatus Poribacteria bacterium]|nr:hypothetical protein [Candidatus Poribacteria bacterium]